LLPDEEKAYAEIKLLTTGIDLGRRKNYKIEKKELQASLCRRWQLQIDYKKTKSGNK
jgi:hypothetical protein